MDTLAWLEKLGHRELRPGTWTLEVVTELCERLGRPHEAFPAVHVAGSRGKGSTCALLESALRAGGRRTGLTTSPHLLSPRERIRLDGEDIEPAPFRALIGRVRDAGAEELQAGYFEVMTAAAFVAFAERRVDVGIVETGLGGRVDATNIVRPLLTVVTRLGMDHADRLGGTRESIAAEKAGILKPGVRAVLGLNDPGAAAVVRARAKEIDAPLREVLTGDLARAPPTSLPGAAQLENAATAWVALEEFALAAPAVAIPPHEAARGFASTSWRARLELLPRALSGADLLLDVAHDVDSTRALLAHLDGLGERRPAALVFTCLADKDLDGIAALLGAAPILRGVSVIVPDLAGARARTPGSVLPVLAQHGLAASGAPSVEAALRQATALAHEGDLVVAFGSFQVAASVLAFLARG